LLLLRRRLGAARRGLGRLAWSRLRGLRLRRLLLRLLLLLEKREKLRLSDIGSQHQRERADRISQRSGF
jgi:hypothetical protein